MWRIQEICQILLHDFGKCNNLTENKQISGYFLNRLHSQIITILFTRTTFSCQECRSVEVRRRTRMQDFSVKYDLFQTRAALLWQLIIKPNQKTHQENKHGLADEHEQKRNRNLEMVKRKATNPQRRQRKQLNTSEQRRGPG